VNVVWRDAISGNRLLWLAAIKSGFAKFF